MEDPRVQLLGGYLGLGANQSQAGAPRGFSRTPEASQINPRVAILGDYLERYATPTYGTFVAQPPQVEEPASQQPGPSVISTLTQPFRNFAGGVSRLLPGGNADIEALERSAEETDRQIRILVERYRQEQNPQIKEQLLSQINQLSRQNVESTTQGSRQIQEDTDMQRFAASAAELGLLAATGGVSRLAGLTRLRPAYTASRGAQAVRTGRATTSAVQSAGRLRDMGLSQIVRAGGVTGAEGAAVGVTQELQQDDPNLVRGAVTGGLLGAAIPVVGAVGGRTLNRIDNLDQAVKNTGIIDKALATAPGQKVQSALKFVQQKFQSNLAPLNRELDNLVASKTITRSEANAVKAQLQTAKFSSGALANSFLRGQDSQITRGSRAAQRLFAPIDGRVLDPTDKRNQRLVEYLSARNEADQMISRRNRGQTIDPSRLKELEDKAALLETPEYRARHEAQVGVYEEIGDLLVKEGILSKSSLDSWRASGQSYARIQRVVDDLSQTAQRGRAGRAIASRGSTVATQKTKGSTREVVNPFLTLVDYTNTIFREIATNRAANAFINTMQEAGALGRQLRSADDVLARQSLRQQLAESRPLQRQLDRFVKSQGRYVRRIQSEINALQRQARKEVTRKVARATRGQMVPEGGVPAENIAGVIEQILSTDMATLNRLNRKFLNREPKLAQAIEELRDLKQVRDALAAERRSQFQEILRRRDEQIAGKPTIQRMVNGVKEVFETTPEIEMAAKNMGETYLGTFGRIISSPVRFFQSTITGGLNPAWAAISIPRDIIEGVVLSSNARATHHPFNILGSFADMLGGKNKELFDRFLASERGVSSVIDLTRDVKSNARSIRELSGAQLPLIKRARVIKNPADFYSALQDASRWNEHYTKYIGFRGMYNDLIKRNVPKERAFQQALWEARNVSGNLLETGDWSKALQAVYPYFNPSVQGGASLAKAFKTRPLATTAKTIMAVQIPAAVSTMWNLSDPRRAEIYMDISESERERYHIVVLPGSEKTDGAWEVIKIPKAPGVGSLANPVERTLMSMYGQDPGEFENFAQSAVKALGSPFDVGSASGFIGSTIPFQARVRAEGIINYSFYRGRQIVPDWLKEANPDEPYKQAYDNTSSTYKKIGKALGISPLIIENFANNTTGEFGRNVTYLSDVAQEMAGISEGGVGGRSLLESFTRGYTGAFGGVENRGFREQLDRTINEKQSLSRQVTEAVKRNDIGEANRIAREYNERVAGLLDTIRNRPEFVTASEAQTGFLESLRFPTKNGKLTKASIESRKNQ